MLFGLQCMVTYAQVIVNPVFDYSDQPSLHIDKVEITPDTTLIYCTFSAEANSWANISGETYIMSYPSKEKHKLLKSFGLPIAPKERDFTLEERCNVLFYFPSIKGSSHFDFIESPDNRAFNIYGVNLSDHFDKKYLESEIKRFSNMSSFYDSSGDTLKTIQYKKDEIMATKYIHGIKSEAYLVSLIGLCSLYEKYGYKREVTELAGTIAEIQADIQGSIRTIFDETAAQKVQSLIMDKEHDKADSVLNWYASFPQNEDGDFLLNLERSLNGYNKIQTCQDMSVIVPYADSGKKTFNYIKNNVNADNAKESNCWPILKVYAEIYNYLDDSVVVDVADFSSRYYNDYKQHDLYTYYMVLQNAYQYLFAKNEWNSAAEAMLSYYNTAIAERDTTIRIPMSAAFIGTAYLKEKDYKNAEKWFLYSYEKFQSYPERIKFRAYCEMLSDMAYNYHLQGDNETACKYAIESCETNKNNSEKGRALYRGLSSFSPSESLSTPPA